MILPESAPSHRRVRVPRDIRVGVRRAFATIRGRITVAFLFTSAIVAALGLSTAISIRHADELVSRTYDNSLMSINYARAAAADFAGMRAANARIWLTKDPALRVDFERRIAVLRQSYSESLEIAVDRAQSLRASRAAKAVAGAVEDWLKARLELTNATDQDAAWSVLDRHAVTADENFDLLVNYTAGDGFTYRQEARAVVARETTINLVGTLVAILLSGTVAYALGRQIIRPVAEASRIAARIAGGDLSGQIPTGSADEVGRLLAAMGVMRDNIRSAMEQEVAQRLTAEGRLADALETSGEGVVVVDAEGRITLTNGQADTDLGVEPGTLVPGTPLAALAATSDPASLARALLRPPDAQNEHRLGDGRWLSIGRSQTQDGGFVAVCSDITLLKDQEARLVSTNLRLDTALDNMSQGLCLFDGDGRLAVVNRRYHEIFDLSPDAPILGLAREDLANLGGLAALDREATLAEPDGTISGRDLHHLANGRIVAVSHKSVLGGGIVTTYEDVTERRQAEARIAYLARHDTLTGLPNRAVLEERIDEALTMAARGSHFAVLCLDLDRFKEINDALGHTVGDALLRAVAERLETCVREVDTVARLGSDEFAIVLADIHRPDDAVVLARHIVDSVGAPYSLDGHRVIVGVSIGISFAPGDGTSSDKLIKNADVALDRAKADGRGTWRFFEIEMDIRLQARRALELDLRQALANDEFQLHYQAVYDFRTRRIGGFEALVRWIHPTRGLVSPGEFIAIAEETGLIVPLGAWCLKAACEEAMRWPEGLKVAVNVSVVQFRDGIVVESVRAALAETGLAPVRLELEITESVLLMDNATTLETLHALRRLGVRIAMDDFGTGYSSLGYLRSFPFDKIKIDQSFVRDITPETESGLIVRAVIGLGAGLGMRTTAEGIETQTQFDRLAAEGCDEGQGYFIARPGPAALIHETLARWSVAAPFPSRAVA